MGVYVCIWLNDNICIYTVYVYTRYRYVLMHYSGTWWYLICICLYEQLWILSYFHVNQLVKAQKEVREHLEKVYTYYDREVAPYEIFITAYYFRPQ